MSLVSAFEYALVTDRALLVSTEGELKEWVSHYAVFSLDFGLSLDISVSNYYCAFFFSLVAASFAIHSPTAPFGLLWTSQ